MTDRQTPPTGSTVRQELEERLEAARCALLEAQQASEDAQRKIWAGEEDARRAGAKVRTAARSLKRARKALDATPEGS